MRGDLPRLTKFQYPLMDRLYFGGLHCQTLQHDHRPGFQYPLMDRLYFGGPINP
mgnify:CR=1 FL=1